MLDRNVASDEKVRVEWLKATLASTRAPSIAEQVSVQAGATAGDDCAVLRVEAPAELVVGTDYVRGSKFRLHELGHLTDRDVARYCVTANVSDVAAMGATPIGYLAIVRYPKELTDEGFEEILFGIDEACIHYGCPLLGGDSGSAERLILAGTALGVAPVGSALLRKTAEPGDVIALTGDIGGAGAAVLAADSDVVSELAADVWGDLLGCWTGYRAQPRVGESLVRTGCRITCEDVSDGLLATLRELGEHSGLSAVVEARSLPLHAGVGSVGEILGLGISASTDFCLCLACTPTDFGAVERALSADGFRVTPIGTFESGSGVWFRDDRGELVAPRGVEWRHQDGAISDVIQSGLRKL